PANTGLPAISGVAQAGQTLSASPGSWTSAPTAFTYQWKRCSAAGTNCTPITVATTASHGPSEADVGSTLRVAVTAANAAGPSAPATSAPSEVVTAAERPPANTGLPAISGVAQAGQTLSASPGSWTGSPTAFSYQWLRCDSAGANCAPIVLATSASYNATEADVGSTLRVAVTAANAAGSSAPATSAPSEVVKEKPSERFVGSIDTMKLSKDHAAGGFTAADAQAVDLAASTAATHITVNTPIEYPATMLAWANRIHADGKHVWFRLS